MRRLRNWLLCLVGSALLASLAGLIVLEQAGYAPRSLGPYIARRGSGHNPLIESTSRFVGELMVRLDRGAQVPAQDYPAWTGAARSRSVSGPAALRERLVHDVESLIAALASARAGDRISLLAGTYRVRQSLRLRAAGTAELPIVVRALQLGDAIIEFEAIEGFNVHAAHWHFENLDIRGRCANASHCEHAFHIVADARYTQLRNNRIADFNAHLKINGENGRFPDNGLAAGNTLYNNHPRSFQRAVVPIDLVAASGWRFEENLIADFVKTAGDRVAYGAYVKGGGQDNRFERNVVLCEHRLRGHRGQRVGMSAGGGSTGAPYCRDKRCVVEQEAAVFRDNLVAQCSDAGIYLNRAARTAIHDNTLLDTAGIDVRFEESSARVSGNLLEGALRSRDGGLLYDEGNAHAPLWTRFLGIFSARRHFEDAASLDLRWRTRAPQREAGLVDRRPDLCSRRAERTRYGAFEDFSDCLARR